jgi:hypothetical protein
VITETDLDILDGATQEDLANWYNTLNAWEWPKELPNEEKKDLDVTGGRRSKLMAAIKRRTPDMLISQLWNKKSLSDKDFKLFYRSSHDGVEELKGEWRRVCLEKIKESNNEN